jgi:hypothetical protein
LPRSVLAVAPSSVTADDLHKLFEDTLRIY